jgi:hypothetical protein
MRVPGCLPKTCPRLFWLLAPRWMGVVLRTGIGPLRPAPAHSQMSLRDGIDVRFREGIQIPTAR